MTLTLEERLSAHAARIAQEEARRLGPQAAEKARARREAEQRRAARIAAAHKKARDRAQRRAAGSGTQKHRPQRLRARHALTEDVRLFFKLYADGLDVDMAAHHASEITGELLEAGEARKLLRRPKLLAALPKSLRRRIKRRTYCGRQPYGLRGEARESEILREIFRRTSGIKFQSVGRIARELNGRGVPGPSGKRWGRTTVHWLLRSRRYRQLVGPIVWNKAQKALEQRRKNGGPRSAVVETRA